MKRGFRFVHGDIELLEKLGRNDPCPCGSGKRFQGMLPRRRPLSMGWNAMIIIGRKKRGRRIGRPRRSRVRQAHPGALL
ncbi:SEC-C metal-binding domain-containing protein [Sphingomonas oligophenolica]|uniref:SEC-C metal-binding domain-containing protein n=1 Tax=Sphingomonas oligophenolica TaxID=301154 RepID=UPI003CD08052